MGFIDCPPPITRMLPPVIGGPGGGLASFDHLVGASEKRRWDPEPECLGSSEVDDKLEFGRLFDRNVEWLCPFKNLVHVARCSPPQVRKVCTISDETADLRKLPQPVHSRQMMRCRKIYDLPPKGLE